MTRDGLHIEVQNGGEASRVGLVNSCFFGIARRTVWDNRPRSLQVQTPQPYSVGRNPGGQTAGCSDPRDPN